MTRVALISDIHGNMVALGAVHDDLVDQKPDRLVCLGDIASLGPSPGPAVRRIRERGCVCVQGNHEEWRTDPPSMERHELPEVIRQATRWCRERLSVDELAFLASRRDRRHPAAAAPRAAGATGLGGEQRQPAVLDAGPAVRGVAQLPATPHQPMPAITASPNSEHFSSLTLALSSERIIRARS